MSPPASSAASVRIERGICHALFVYDVGLSIDLPAAERLLSQATTRAALPLRRSTPRYFAYRPAPLRMTHDGPQLALGGFSTSVQRTILLHDFGAAAVAYSIPLAGSIDSLLDLSDALFNDAELHADSRAVIATLTADLRGAIQRPQLADFVEEYAIYQLEACTPQLPAAEFLARHRELIARILRSERGALSDSEVADALACVDSYRPDDLAVVDWNATLLLDDDADDVRGVLEFANIELLELRYLDEQLDAALSEAGRAVARRAWRLPLVDSRRADLQRIADLQMDFVLLFEGVNNTLKLLGDQYLARIYRLAAQRLHLSDWDASILRKLQTLESIYDKLSDRQANRRMEMLEWIIIVLILISIVIPFVLAGGH